MDNRPLRKKNIDDFCLNNKCLLGTSNNSVRHCGLDPQSSENKEILKQVQNDGGIFRSPLYCVLLSKIFAKVRIYLRFFLTAFQVIYDFMIIFEKFKKNQNYCVIKKKVVLLH